jgi:hypothetical protein
MNWTKPHRDSIKVAVQSGVKLVLRRKRVKPDEFDFILNRVMEQAAALYSEWPIVA